MNPAVASPWMTAEQCAAYLGVSLDSLYQFVRRNGLPASRMGGTRLLRFHKQYVDEWVESGNAHDPRVERALSVIRGRR